MTCSIFFPTTRRIVLIVVLFNWTDGFSNQSSTDLGPRTAVISRRVGIKAGGTRIEITIRFDNVIPHQSVIKCFFIGEKNIYNLSLKIYDGRRQVFDIRSPLSHQAGIVPMSVEYIDGIRESLGEFEYRENPVITNIHPMKHIVSGGTRFTLEGENLEAVESCYIRLTDTDYEKNQLTSRADCFGIINRSLVCRMPPLPTYVDEAPSDLDDGYTKPGFRRKKRSASDADLSKMEDWRNNSSIYIHIFTDDFLPALSNETNFEFVVKYPVVYRFNETIRIRSGNSDAIQLKGENLALVEADNYIVQVGNENCTILSVTDNLISFMPTLHKPRTRDSYPSNCTSEERPLSISINSEESSRYVFGCALYSSGQTTVTSLWIILVTLILSVTTHMFVGPAVPEFMHK